jgi:hypothetical protein
MAASEAGVGSGHRELATAGFSQAETDGALEALGTPLDSQQTQVAG